MTLAEKIEYLVKQSSKTKVELAKELEIKSSSSLSQWIKGKTKPSRENIERLAGVFNRDISYFTDDEETRSTGNMVFDSGKAYINTNNIAQVKHIGILGGIYNEVFKVPFYCIPEGYLPVMIEAPSSAKPYALRIESDAIFDGMQKGDIAIIVPSQESPSGKTALIKMQEEYQFKRVFWNPDHILLKNGKKQIKTQKDQFEVIGQVIGIFKNI
ncbi:SOS-response transcriptional repressor LexA [Elusimicrobium posterum]|uniref:helix-turn-helix domain-containing protein n=1 Tax=Elusimicrobium posterum TaxID=3116653 RepID=UPI003C7859F6